MTTTSSFMSTLATLASLVASLLQISYFRFAMFFPPMRSPKSKVRFVECERQPIHLPLMTVNFRRVFGCNKWKEAAAAHNRGFDLLIFIPPVYVTVSFKNFCEQLVHDAPPSKA